MAADAPIRFNSGVRIPLFPMAIASLLSNA
jgi:hypothetical protein